MNEFKKEFLGIKAWHDMGIKGQGITVASIENGLTTHSKMVLDVLRQILPEATILTDVKYWHKEEIPQELDGYTCSEENSSSDNPDKVQAQRELYERGVFMTCSVGNSGSEHFNKLAKYDEWVSVGACQLYDDGDVIPEHYSSECEKLDFCSVTNWDTERGYFNGTSCSAPVLQGMAMLVKCYYRLRGKELTNQELYNYIRRHCVDIFKEWFDSKTGHGLFILPKEIEEMEIELKIGQKNAIVDGKTVELDVAPKIENGRTLVPIRFIAEALGCDVDWDSLTRTVYIRR